MRLVFIRKCCDRLDTRFPEEELKEWSAFDTKALSPDISIGYGSTNFATLAKQYEAIHCPLSVQAINSEYAEFKYTMKQKLKQGSASTFLNMVAAALVKM